MSYESIVKLGNINQWILNISCLITLTSKFIMPFVHKNYVGALTIVKMVSLLVCLLSALMYLILKRMLTKKTDDFLKRYELFKEMEDAE